MRSTQRCLLLVPSPNDRTVESGSVVDLFTGNLERLVEKADAEMYRAKKAGKNRVSAFDERSVPH